MMRFVEVKRVSAPDWKKRVIWCAEVAHELPGGLPLGGFYVEDLFKRMGKGSSSASCPFAR